MSPEPSSIKNPARAEEEAYLKKVKERIEKAIERADRRLRDYAEEIQEQKTYLWESRDEMDHIEKISQRESIGQMVMSGDQVLDQKKRLKKLQKSLYFGRFDFEPEGGAVNPVYIGIHHFRDEAEKKTLVHDWRAPIAALFYDYETGPARYEAPEGMVDGHIRLKRQFRIKHGQIELMIDSAVNVVDEVLQDELGRSADEGMKNIVATIQRDQNAIIRDDDAAVLIIQGVAGSGKTSIALHRIAFLLYRFKDTLTSEDILIISPNRVFADYIANVLPELGEETVNEIRMEDLADDLLEGDFKFQTFFEQTNALLTASDESLLERVQFKARPELLRELDRYTEHLEKQRFQARDLKIARRPVPAFFLEELYNKYRSYGPKEGIKKLLSMAEQRIGVEYRYELTPEDRRQLRDEVRSMVHDTTLRQAYRGFYDWLGHPELFKTARGNRLEYADVFPLIYLKIRLERTATRFRQVKHLLVDEMQDYTPVQYAVLNQFFKCNKTILGDARQSINPYSASTIDQIRDALSGAACTYLNKSYRSSIEITRFTQRISPNPELIAIERHGEEPQVIRCNSRARELGTLAEQIRALGNSEHNSLAVICKTEKQAQQCADALEKESVEAQLLTEASTVFSSGAVIATAHLAKGLEFDRVIVPFANDKTYQNEMDRNLLYVACTRAMHRLTLTYTGTLTPLIGES